MEIFIRTIQLGCLLVTFTWSMASNDPTTLGMTRITINSFKLAGLIGVRIS
jgi:hypothetical protein